MQLQMMEQTIANWEDSIFARKQHVKKYCLQRSSKQRINYGSVEWNTTNGGVAQMYEERTRISRGNQRASYAVSVFMTPLLHEEADSTKLTDCTYVYTSYK